MPRSALVRSLDRQSDHCDVDVLQEALEPVSEDLGRALAIGSTNSDVLAAPELIALELRNAHARLQQREGDDLPEVILGRIFADFCVGK